MTPTAIGTSMIRAATRAATMSTMACSSATVPMPLTLPMSSCRGLIIASSTSTTRDSFSRLTAVTTHWP